MPKDGYHHENLKDELIREGLTILDREGYEGFSLRKVARACGVSQTAPYRHFKDKDALIAAILMEAMRAFNQSLEEAALRYPEDPKGRLKEIGVAYVRFFSQRPEYLRLLFSNGIPGRMDAPGGCQDLCGPEVRLKSGHPFKVFYSAVERYAAACPDAAAGRDELLLYCWGLVHGISVLISGKGELPCGENCLEMAEKVIRSDNLLR